MSVMEKHKRKMSKLNSFKIRMEYKREERSTLFRALFPKKEKKTPTTTKLAMLYIFANCTVIEIYSMVVMIQFADLSALYSLIGAVIGESLAFIAYLPKSYLETKQQEIIQLERDRMNMVCDIPEDSDFGGEEVTEEVTEKTTEEIT